MCKSQCHQGPPFHTGNAQNFGEGVDLILGVRKLAPTPGEQERKNQKHQRPSHKHDKSQLQCAAQNIKYHIANLTNRRGDYKSHDDARVIIRGGVPKSSKTHLK